MFKTLKRFIGSGEDAQFSKTLELGQEEAEARKAQDTCNWDAQGCDCEHWCESLHQDASSTEDVC